MRDGIEWWEFIKENKKVKTKENTLSIKKASKKKERKQPLDQEIRFKKKEGRKLKTQLELNIQPNFFKTYNLVESINDRHYFKWMKVKFIDT